MDKPTPKRPAVFIEKMMPVQVLNEQVNFEHGGNPFKGLHRWYSRKPLSFSRASVLASLLPADITMQEFEYLLGLVPGQEVKLYKTPPNSVQIKKVQDYCEKVWGTRTPTVLDAFAGGGSIPFEAARYGLNVLASDLNPVAVVTMKAAMEYPLKFGPDLQQDIDKWVKWVGDEAEKRLAEFFPSLPGETVQNYLWAHTVVCPSCESVVPLSPNWWLDRSPGSAKKGKLCAVKPISNPDTKKVDFELIVGRKGKGTTILTDIEYNPETTITMSRGVGRCSNCNSVIDNDIVMEAGKQGKMGHQLYGIAYRTALDSLEFRLPVDIDILATDKALNALKDRNISSSIYSPSEDVPPVTRDTRLRLYGIEQWSELFNPRQLLTLVNYVEIIQEAKLQILAEYEHEKAQAIATYLALVFDRCVDLNSRLSHWDAGHPLYRRASTSHSLNLFWCYPETTGTWRLWQKCGEAVSGDYSPLCSLLGTKVGSTGIPGIEIHNSKLIQVDAASADNLAHIPDKSVDAVITDPPYYATIQYAELSDFFYVWLKRTLGDILPELFYLELTDKDREAVANPSRFKGMGTPATDTTEAITPEKLANQDYEAKMAMAFAEYHRVLRDDGVMTVQIQPQRLRRVGCLSQIPH